MDQWLFYFFTYAFLGWCTEVLYTYYKRRQWINRGFLNGPLCPIYGVGMLLMAGAYIAIFPDAYGAPLIRESSMGVHLAYVFFMVTILTTVLELVTGMALEGLFATKWWDYSTRMLNVKGYVCLKFSMIWGGAGTALILVAHPWVMGLFERLESEFFHRVILSLSILFAIDMALTIYALIDFKRLLVEFERLTAEYTSTKEKLVRELEHIVHELDPQAGRIRTEISRVAGSVQMSKDRLADEFDRFGDELVVLRQKLRAHVSAIKSSDRLPNGELKEFLSKKLDLDRRLRTPIKTNMHDIYDRVNRMSSRLSRHRLFKSFPEMRSDKFETQLRAMREKYDEARNMRRGKK